MFLKELAERQEVVACVLSYTKTIKHCSIVRLRADTLYTLGQKLAYPSYQRTTGEEDTLHFICGILNSDCRTAQDLLSQFQASYRQLELSSGLK